MTEFLEDDIEFDDDFQENTDSYSSFSDSVYSYSNQTKAEFDKAFPTEYKKFTEEDYIELNKNLVLYKTGNLEAAQYIVSMFHRFVKKYADFICYGYYGENYDKEPKEYNSKFTRPYDKSLTKFISLFVSKSDRDKAKHSNERALLFSDACIKIQKLFSKFEYWDIYNELICALLNMANKYKITKEGDVYHKENGTFHMYVNKCFHFDAYNTLTKIAGDPLAHLKMFSIESEFEPEAITYSSISKNSEANFSTIDKIGMRVILKDMDTDKIIEKMLIKSDRQKKLEKCTSLVLKEEDVDPYEMESLNFNWTNGNTCGDEFKNLTSYERELIVMSYVQNKTDAEIASIYGCHRITIVKHRKMAIEKIKTYIAENGGKSK